MEGKSSLIQGLPLITIIVVLLLFIIVRVVSRFKKQALGDTSGKNLLNLQFDAKSETETSERIQLKRPALIEKPGGVMKVGIKELTTSGAFVTCPQPFAIGESFLITILLNEHDPHTFNAEVIWNNQNVIEEEIIIRGMKIRFLQLTEKDRQTIQETIARRQQVTAIR